MKMNTKSEPILFTKLNSTEILITDSDGPSVVSYSGLVEYLEIAQAEYEIDTTEIISKIAASNNGQITIIK